MFLYTMFPYIMFLDVMFPSIACLVSCLFVLCSLTLYTFSLYFVAQCSLELFPCAMTRQYVPCVIFLRSMFQWPVLDLVYYLTDSYGWFRSDCWDPITLAYCLDWSQTRATPVLCHPVFSPCCHVLTLGIPRYLVLCTFWLNFLTFFNNAQRCRFSLPCRLTCLGGSRLRPFDGNTPSRFDCDIVIPGHHRTMCFRHVRILEIVAANRL